MIRRLLAFFGITEEAHPCCDHQCVSEDLDDHGEPRASRLEWHTPGGMPPI